MDWVGTVLNIIGLWLLAKDRRHAMYVYVLSSIAFLIWSVGDGVWSIAALQAVLLVLNVRVILTWRKINGNGPRHEQTD